MNEAQTRAELIDPALKAAGWSVDAHSRILREHVIAPGRIQGAGAQATALSADYVLVFKNTRLAVIEAKAVGKPYTEGVAQAKNYAEKLKIRFAFATNGAQHYRVDMETGEETDAAAFPSPQELWDATYAEPNAWRERFAAVTPEDKGGTFGSRYYQEIAIRRVLEAIGSNKKRMLLTLATGTGKTVIAFQIAWKLFHAKWNLSGEPSRAPRILFLADRNILADQAFNTFSPFEMTVPGSLVRIAPDEIRKKGKVPTNGSIFFTIFQTFMTGRDADGKEAPYFGAYPNDFFDCIIIDECHRGGARDESTWRAILNYFDASVQLGLTATPKRDDNIDTYAYFGNPLYEYALKDGINDGFLTPFRVRQVATTIDEYTYVADDEVEGGAVPVGQQFVEKDFNRIVEIEARERYRVELVLQYIQPHDKTIIFCASQVHALAVRNLINQLKSVPDPNYCHRVTANDGALGEQYLREFQDNEKTIPTILTTSQKLSTGVDARNVRNIVLMRPINSMIEFKQIIGRGTRLFEDKFYFTVIDFVKAHHHFNDPDWDGEPQGPEPEPDATTPTPPSNGAKSSFAKTDIEPTPILRIKLANGKELAFQHMQQLTFWGADGKPLSLQQFLEKFLADAPQHFATLADLTLLWQRPDSRKTLLTQLAENGYGADDLKRIQEAVNAADCDLFDVLAHAALAEPLKTRATRADVAAKALAGTVAAPVEGFLKFVLGEYVKLGVGELAMEKLGDLLTLRYGSVTDAIGALGDLDAVREAFVAVQWTMFGATGPTAGES